MNGRGRRRAEGISTSGLDSRRFRLAGLACLVGALALGGLAIASGRLQPGAAHAPFVFVLMLAGLVIGSLCLFLTPWLWRRMRSVLALLWLARVLAVVLLARTVGLFTAGAGWRWEIPGGLRFAPGDDQPILLLKASLFGLMALAVVRAAWLSAPLTLDWRARSANGA